MARTTQADNKTKPSTQSVADFIANVAHTGRREDAGVLLDLMTRVTGESPTMWGASIVGFGQYHYVYESGREGDHMLTGFAPRKANMVVYIMPGFKPYKDLLAQLGPFKTGSSCLYLGRLKNINLDVLEALIAHSVADMRAKYGGE